MSARKEKIAFLTSGGDAPGMNACLRAVVRNGIVNDFNVYAVMRGYTGLIKGEFEKRDARSVSNIIEKGGTVIKTARSKEFMTDQGKQKARDSLERNNISALIAAGGEGTFKGLIGLRKIWDGRVIAVPATIDNDIYGTDNTIGYDTAMNTALSAIDRIRDTADAHERYFVVEVMGRKAGFIAINVGLAGGAEEVLIPERETDLERIAENSRSDRKNGKRSSIIVVAEGDDAGNGIEIADKLREITGNEYKTTVLGHIQRGGSPGVKDRILGTRLGAFAIDALKKGMSDVMVGVINGEVCTVSLEEAANRKKGINRELLDLIEIMGI